MPSKDLLFLMDFQSYHDKGLSKHHHIYCQKKQLIDWVDMNYDSEKYNHNKAS